MEPEPIHELYQAIMDGEIMGASIDYFEPGGKFSGRVVEIKVRPVCYIKLKARTEGDNVRDVTFAKNTTKKVERIDHAYGKGWRFTTSEDQEIFLMKPHQ